MRHRVVSGIFALSYDNSGRVGSRSDGDSVWFNALAQDVERLEQDADDGQGGQLVNEIERFLRGS